MSLFFGVNAAIYNHEIVYNIRTVGHSRPKFKTLFYCILKRILQNLSINFNPFFKKSVKNPDICQAYFVSRLLTLF